MDTDSGLVTTTRPLQSYERFNLTVVATDGGQPPLWGTSMLLVEVIDVNDNRPVFVRPPNGTILHIREVGALEEQCSRGGGGTEAREAAELSHGQQSWWPAVRTDSIIARDGLLGLLSSSELEAALRRLLGHSLGTVSQLPAHPSHTHAPSGCSSR